jgi:hypothetical protein
LIGKPEGNRPFGTWEDNIRMDLREIWWKDVEWINLAGNFLKS